LTVAALLPMLAASVLQSTALMVSIAATSAGQLAMQ
jgi:hypothetical protein